MCLISLPLIFSLTIYFCKTCNPPATMSGLVAPIMQNWTIPLFLLYFHYLNAVLHAILYLVFKIYFMFHSGCCCCLCSIHPRFLFKLIYIFLIVDVCIQASQDFLFKLWYIFYFKIYFYLLIEIFIYLYSISWSYLCQWVLPICSWVWDNPLGCGQPNSSHILKWEWLSFTQLPSNAVALPLSMGPPQPILAFWLVCS